jgi:hypothetical protein
MSRTFLNRRRRHLLTSYVLALLLFRAYVPIGFMPASGAPFLVELCPAASTLQMSMPMPGHYHSDTHSHFEICPFGGATAAGPAPVFGAIGPLPQIESKSAGPIESLPVGVGRIHLPQPRGPPLVS